MSDKPKIVCNACGSTILKHFKDVTLLDYEDAPWAFSAYTCECGACTLVTYDEASKVATLPG